MFQELHGEKQNFVRVNKTIFLSKNFFTGLSFVLLFWQLFFKKNVGLGKNMCLIYGEK